MIQKSEDPIIDLDKMYRILAKKYNLEIYQIRRICNSMFEYTKNNIKNKDYSNVYIPFIGSFQPKLRFKHESSKIQESKDSIY